jgi:hypothetical protein
VLLAIDPGMNSPGVALFRTATLLAADRVFIPVEYASLSDGARWLSVAREIARRAHECGCVTDVVFERPQWYARGKSKGDPNQLAGIAGVAANVTGILSTYAPLRVMSPTPAEWIGQLPKTCRTCKANKKKCPACKGSAWMTPRGQRIRSRLTDAELALVPDQNDAIDAVGLGLWALGRLTPRTVFSNGNDGR